MSARAPDAVEHVSNATQWSFEPMSTSTRPETAALLSAFLREDAHYLSTSAAYGDGGETALVRALDLFLTRPELGMVWIALEGRQPVAACVVCFAISTARGSLVGKLDDVSVRTDRRGCGIGSAMLRALALWLRARGASRIDCACHRDNHSAWRFYERLGFRSLHEERIAWLLA